MRLPGTADSSPIYVHGALVGGATRNVAVVTTTYGRTVAIDADSGRILWTFTPPGYGRVAGSSQITTTSPLVDPSRAFVYAASPDGLVHKLALAGGTEAREGSWPVSVNSCRFFFSVQLVVAVSFCPAGILMFVFTTLNRSSTCRDDDDGCAVT